MPVSRRSVPLLAVLLAGVTAPALAQDEPARPTVPEPVEVAEPATPEAAPAVTPASAPLTYRWEMKTHERLWATDPETPRTNRLSTATVRTTIQRMTAGVIVTITAVEMDAPDTPAGDLYFNSEDAPEPEADAETPDATEPGTEPAPSNMLEAPLRAVIGMPLEFRYDAERRTIRGPAVLEKMPASRFLAGLLLEPYCTTALYPFFEDAGGEAAPRKYTLVPGGAMAKVADFSVDLEAARGTDDEGRRTLGGPIAGGVEGVLPGQLGPDGMSIAFKGETRATYTADGAPLSHRAVTSTETNFMYGPTTPVRNLLETTLVGTLVTE